MLSNILNNLIIQAKLAIQKSDNIHALEMIRIKFLGKKGYVNQHIKNLSYDSYNISSSIGTKINETKKEISNLLSKRKKFLDSQEIEKTLNKNILDITLPGRHISIIGKLHPITQVIEYMQSFFYSLGFSMINGPEIENDYFNFDALNIPKNHPARDEHDTFWLSKNMLLRTHITGIQIRTLMKNKFKKPPMRIISFGRVYRKDYDKNHTPMFHQMEGFIIDEIVNFSYLKKMLYDFIYNFFERDIKLRFRPSYFPFTEPSAEIDIMEKKSKTWLEVLGCGVIHPNILNNFEINTKKFSGLAFGIGIERLIMLLYCVHDIRKFFENDLNFLDQFK